jgi:hypothetical protein
VVGLLRRSRHGTLYFRYVVPSDVRATLGTSELSLSLGIRRPADRDDSDPITRPANGRRHEGTGKHFNDPRPRVDHESQCGVAGLVSELSPLALPDSLSTQSIKCARRNRRPDVEFLLADFERVCRRFIAASSLLEECRPCLQLTNKPLGNVAKDVDDSSN